MLRRLVRLAVAIFTMVAVVTNASAQKYPDKPVRLVVGYSAGSGVDIIGRTLAEELSNLWGQPVIVDNRPAAAGNLAADMVAKATPDGYTLLLVTSSHTINPALYGNLRFDTAKDFTAISTVVSSPLILVVGPAMPVNSVQELIAALKLKRGDANYSSAGNGNLTHLAAELFKAAAGVEMVHIPFNGGGPAISEVVAGRVALYFSGLPPALPQIAAGKLKALAVTTSKRSPSAPDVPTMMEAGLSGYEVDLWYGLLGPAKLPQTLVAKINADVAKVLMKPEVVQRFTQLGVTSNPSSPADFQTRIDVELKKWAVEVPRIGIKLE